MVNNSIREEEKMKTCATCKTPAKCKAAGKCLGKGYAAGGLKMPGADQKGLKKLPKPVRNKMGYMSKGGMAKKGYRGGGFCTGPAKGMKK